MEEAAKAEASLVSCLLVTTSHPLPSALQNCRYVYTQIFLVRKEEEGEDGEGGGVGEFQKLFILNNLYIFIYHHVHLSHLL